MKGIANWIMIIGSVIIGITIFFISATLIMKQMEITQRQNILEQIQELYERLESTCNMGKGNKYYYNIALPDNVRAVYVADSNHELPPDKVSEMITEQKTSDGNYLCIQFFDDNLPTCQEISCTSEFTYIGSPSLKTTLQTLVASIRGNYPVYKYKITIEKTDEYFLSAISHPEV